jgi:hypothetical protein
MYDGLIEHDPKMRKMRTESEAKGKLEGLQEAVITVTEGRFPSLTELARQRAPRVTKPDVLLALVRGIAIAPDESSARVLLEFLTL